MRDPFARLARVRFEGPSSDHPLCFRFYDADRLVEGRPMRDHLRFAACFWHTMRNGLGDPFGEPVAAMPWEAGLADPLDLARARLDAFFSLIGVLGIRHWCFHDRDVAPEGATVAESERHLDAAVAHAEGLQKSTGIRPLWGTANLFSHPRYVHGAATSDSPEVFARAAAQVATALEATHRLGGAGYVFWGGREGYSTLLNTDLAREQRHLARFLRLAAEHADSIGFRGSLYLEPKPKEPSIHQYDFDAATCLAFLREHGLAGRFLLNIETNHATLAGHSMEHELRVAAAAGALGSIDANMGDEHAGWDTDRFPTDPALAARVMLEVLAAGGFRDGGLNFDAKRRRGSLDPLDLVHAHVAGMDAFARGLLAAEAIRRDGRLAAFVRDRYAAWDGPLGRSIEEGATSLARLREHARASPEPTAASGRQEVLEALFWRFL
ncbi:MAG: xylose isomerase [Phycisphaerae bacterium]|nr:xylose isomerase [Phycisphaerae bacterium]